MRTTRTLQTIIIHLFIAIVYIGAQDYLRMCIVNAGARKRQTTARFTLSHIDRTLCSHYIYAYALVDPGSKTIVAAEPAEEEGNSGLYASFNNLKTIRTTFKTLLSVGGPGPSQHTAFKTLSNNAQNSDNFSHNAVAFLRQRYFDGIVVDWALPEDKTQLIVILQSLRRKIDADQARPKLLLTVKCPGIIKQATQGFDAVHIDIIVDYALLSTYRLVDPRYAYTYCTAPLNGKPGFTIEMNLNVNDSISDWKRRGLSYNKMLMGISAVGLYVRISIPHNYGVGVDAETEILRGSVYNFTSGLAYPEICMFLKNARRFFDSQRKCPFAVNQLEWVGYDDNESLGHKMDYIKNLSLAGIMFAGMDEDDFTGQGCQKGRYPLLRFIRSRITNYTEVPTTLGPETTEATTSTLAPTTETTQPPAPVSSKKPARRTFRPPGTHPTTTPGFDSETDGDDNHWLVAIIVLVFFVVALLLLIAYVFVCPRPPAPAT